MIIIIGLTEKYALLLISEFIIAAAGKEAGKVVAMMLPLYRGPCRLMPKSLDKIFEGRKEK